MIIEIYVSPYIIYKYSDRYGYIYNRLSVYVKETLEESIYDVVMHLTHHLAVLSTNKFFHIHIFQ